MIKPKIIKATNPQTGKVIEKIRWPNVFVYGLTETELEILNKSLPGKEVEITDVTGDAPENLSGTIARKKDGIL